MTIEELMNTLPRYSLGENGMVNNPFNGIYLVTNDVKALLEKAAEQARQEEREKVAREIFRDLRMKLYEADHPTSAWCIGDINMKELEEKYLPEKKDNRIRELSQELSELNNKHGKLREGADMKKRIGELEGKE